MILATHNTRPRGVHGISTDHIHAHLEKILASALFISTRRLKSVLRYLVLQAVNGTSAALNEYRIALEAFDKSESFDPGTDPIVRVEMSRLRTRLERYYDDYIVDDGLSFELPRGTYALSIKDSFAGSITPASFGDSSPITIGISPLHAASGTRDTEMLCVQVTKELVEILGNEPYVSAVAHVTRVEPRIYGHLVTDTDRWPGIDFIVEGSMQTWSPLVYATMRLIDVKRGVVHVLGHYVYKIEQMFTARMDLPSAIMADIRSHLLRSRNGSRHDVTPLGGEGARLDLDWREPSAATIDTIVEAAIQTFADCGYFGATVGAIAVKAQVADRCVLDVFGNKIRLFIESVRMHAHRTLDLPHLEKLLTAGDVKGKALQGFLLAAIRRWYATLSIERARLSIYAGLKEDAEYQHLMQEPINRVMRHLTQRHLTRGHVADAPPSGTGTDIRAAAQSLIVFLIYFRVAPWSPDPKDTHDEVVDAIVTQSLTCLFGHAIPPARATGASRVTDCYLPTLSDDATIRAGGLLLR
jgi:AcrR family transcriptional regulator/TolB-like protein